MQGTNTGCIVDVAIATIDVVGAWLFLVLLILFSVIDLIVIDTSVAGGCIYCCCN